MDKIISILNQHGVYNRIVNNRIMALEAITPTGDEWRDVTDFSNAQLYDFLGYE